MSICKNCRRRLKPWAKEFEGIWEGCNLLLDEHTTITSAQEAVYAIDCEQMATGWITDGHMAFNDQILTKGTTKCRYFQEKGLGLRSSTEE